MFLRETDGSISSLPFYSLRSWMDIDGVRTGAFYFPDKVAQQNKGLELKDKMDMVMGTPHSLVMDTFDLSAEVFQKM